MLVKCYMLDKFHACFARERWPSARTNMSIEQMAEAIYVRIPEDTKLQDLFLRWSHLSLEEMNSIDDSITNQRHHLYVALKRALRHYNNVQDTSGAPGVQSGLFAFTCDIHLDEELARLIARVDHLIERSQGEVIPAEQWD